MTYFLAMTWPWWLAAIVVAVAIIWLIFRFLDRGASGTADTPASTESAELAAAKARITELEKIAGEVPLLQARVTELEADAAGPGTEETDPVKDMRMASAVIGFPVTLDNLAVVEGIGPKIRELLHASNIRTWRELSTTPVAMLNQILDDAGPQFRMHDPATWPRQAGLLTDGHWGGSRNGPTSSRAAASLSRNCPRD